MCVHTKLGVFLVIAILAESAASAHETDQYSVPLGREFADLRLYFSEVFHDRIVSAVEKTNARIEHSLRHGDSPEATAQLQSPDTIAWALLLECPPVMNYVETLEFRLRTPELRNRYPGLVVAHQPFFWIYHHWALLLDFTKPVRLARTSTIMIDGTYLGTDKIVHFVHMGYLYFAEYRRAKSQELSDQEATRRAVALGTGGNLLLSENTLLGMLTTGVRSNADLAANYAGLKFFRNLTEEVSIRGTLHPPMLVRDGPLWKLNIHVRPTSDFFSVFVTDHWDEALNVCTYGPGIGFCVRQQLRKRCDDLLAWYYDEQGKRRTREQFVRIAEELDTYFGEDYGHLGTPAETVNIANSCFDAEREATSNPTPTASAGNSDEGVSREDLNETDRLGRDAVWWAAARGELEHLRRLLARGAHVDAADLDGETPLHCAARWGHTEIADLLLSKGADPNAQTRYGTTPLHLAVRELRSETAKTIIEHGADVNRRDTFGCVPLHDVAKRGDLRLAAMLLDAGADVDIQDNFGTTPLHSAARCEYDNLVSYLLLHNADATLANALGCTAPDVARSRRSHGHPCPIRGSQA